MRLIYTTSGQNLSWEKLENHAMTTLLYSTTACSIVSRKKWKIHKCQIGPTLHQGAQCADGVL